MIDKNFAKLMYDIQNMLWSYNSIILWNQNMWIWFRNCCEAEAQSNLWSLYIAMWDDEMRQIKMNEINEMKQMNFISSFRSVKIYEFCNLMKWSSQSQQSVELTDNEWTDNEQWQEWYDEQWWCNSDKDIL